MITYGVILIIVLVLMLLTVGYLQRTPEEAAKNLVKLEEKVKVNWKNYLLFAGVALVDILLVIYIIITLC